MKTVKQLADSLGVSKTSIRKRLTDDFRQHYVQASDTGTLYITDEGCELIAETTANHRKPFAETTTNQSGEFAETTANQSEKFAETTANHCKPFVETTANQAETLLLLLQEQLAVKDRQISALQEQVSELTKSLHSLTTSLSAEQALHAGTMQGRLDNSDDVVEPKHRKGIFGFLKKNK